ncbi:MAG TPA: hypothetical protein VK841_22720 [Polyangiaceae bacterium]|nr:hypothetical protein [Polyangiaceae bacterium]
MTPFRAATVSAAIVASLIVAAMVLTGECRSSRNPEEGSVEPAGTAPPARPSAEPVASWSSAPVAPSGPPLAPPAVAAGPVALLADASVDEASLMAQLRGLVDVDPARAYDLAKQGARLFPNSADAPEMAAIAVKSLARQGKRSEARGEAETMVNQYPDSPWAREVEQHTGAHPHRDQRAP